jgi:asparagine synthetase B (glutamine-hydrolysing)
MPMRVRKAAHEHGLKVAVSGLGGDELFAGYPAFRDLPRAHRGPPARGPRSPFAKVAALEAELYMRNQLLRDADWASMAHSLEVRVPLVDLALLRRLAPLSLRGKRLLAASLPRPLPETVVHRAKTGFTTPVERWTDRLIGPAARPEPWPRRWARLVAQRKLPGDALRRGRAPASSRAPALDEVA